MPASDLVNLPAWGYRHKTVCHGRGEYARDEDGDGFCEVHVNTIEGFWSLLRSWLRPHRGISQDKLPLYLGFFQFVHNARRRGKALLGALVAALVAWPNLTTPKPDKSVNNCCPSPICARRVPSVTWEMPLAHIGEIPRMDDRPHIVVVEDEVTQRDMLVHYLSRHEFRVNGAEDGATLRRLVDRDLPSLVMLDIGLPGEDGFALVRWLRERSGRIGIILVTAASDTVDRVMGLESGADDYIAKPFKPRELLARVKSVLRRTELSDAQELQAATAEVLRAISRVDFDLETVLQTLVRTVATLTRADGAILWRYRDGGYYYAAGHLV